jgi:hypothetical protein
MGREVVVEAERPVREDCTFRAVHDRQENLDHHPHVHCIVPGGGISSDGTRWIPCRPDFFLPVRVLSRLFRRLFLCALEAAFAAGELEFFGDLAALQDATTFKAYPVRRGTAPGAASLHVALRYVNTRVTSRQPTRQQAASGSHCEWLWPIKIWALNEASVQREGGNAERQHGLLRQRGVDAPKWRLLHAGRPSLARSYFAHFRK